MYKNILLPIDINQKGSWNITLPVAIAQARMSGDSCTLHVMTAISDGSNHLIQTHFSQGKTKNEEEIANKAIKNFINEHVPKDLKVKMIIATCSPIYECIISTAIKIKSDLIIISAIRTQLKDYLLGPNSAKVVRHAKTSVLVVR